MRILVGIAIVIVLVVVWMIRKRGSYIYLLEARIVSKNAQDYGVPESRNPAVVIGLSWAARSQSRRADFVGTPSANAN